MSRFSSIFSAVAQPVLLTHLGETVTRYPLGVVANAVSVEGIFAERMPEQNTARGDDNDRTGTLEVASTVTVDARDSWLINSEIWETVAVANASNGMRPIQLRRNERQRTRPVGVR